MSYLVGMRKLLSLAVSLGVIGSMTAVAMSDRYTDPREGIDQAQVEAQIDARLHEVLVKMRHARYRH